MPTKISQLFNENGLTCQGQVGWGQSIDSSSNGFYVLALTDNMDELVSMPYPDFNDAEIQGWINRIKSLGKHIQLDENIADLESIKTRLTQFWFPDETILYIGKAGPSILRSIGKRVNEYYTTPLGCKRPHAGGNWVNALKNISSLNIFYSQYTGDIEEKEQELISYFNKYVSETTREKLFDQINCFPFANKEIYLKSQRKKVRKQHGFKYQTVKCSRNP